MHQTLNETSTPKLLSSRQAAARLGISPANFHRKVASGDIPRPVRFGHRSLWPVADIDEVIERLIAARDTAA